MLGQSDRRPHAVSESRLPRATWAGLLLVLTVAAVQRAVCWSALSALPLFLLPDGDAGVYDAWARRFAAGDFALGHEVLRMSPGYFYALGGVYALLGDGPWAFRLVQGACGLGSVALIWDCARRLYGPRWALCAGLIAALYGPLAFFEGVQLADALGAVLHGALLWLAIVMLLRYERGIALGQRDFAQLGLAYGLCAALRPNALLLALPLAWMIGRCAWYAPRAWVRGLLVFALAAGCAIAPITLRNYFAAGEPVLLTAHGGLNVYLGNGPGATGTFRVPPEIADARGPAEQFDAFHTAAEQAVGHELSARAADGYWFGRALQHVEAQPWAWLRLMAKKLRLFWNGREVWDVYHYDFYRGLDLRLRFSLPFAALAALSLLGTLRASRRQRPAERFIGLFNLTTCLAIVLVLVSARYRLAMFAGAVLASTCALRGLLQALRRRGSEPLRLAVNAGALAACVVFTWPVAIKRSVADEEYWKLGAGYFALGRLPEAEAAYLRGLQLNPQHDGSHYDLARLYERSGRTGEAASHWDWLLRWSTRVGDAQLMAEARAHLAPRAAALGDAPLIDPGTQP